MEENKDYIEYHYIYVLDYSDCSICEIAISDNERTMEPEDIIEEHGCNISTSSWMFSNNKIENIIEI